MDWLRVTAALVLTGCTFGGGGSAVDPDDDTGGADDDADGSPATTQPATTATSTPNPSDTGADSVDGDTDTTSEDEDTVGAACPDGWWDAAWGRRIWVEVQSAGVDAMATPVPLALPLDMRTPSLAGVADDGRDLRFVTAEGEPIAAELERPPSGESYVAWLRLPQVGGPESMQGLWMYFGNADAEPDDDAGAVWEGYEGVWHLSDADGSFGNSGAAQVVGEADGTSLARGQLAAGVEFDGRGGTVDFGKASTLLLDGWGGMSASMWLYIDQDSDQAWEAAGPGAILRRGGGFRFGRAWRPDGGGGAPNPGMGHFQIDIETVDGMPAYRRFDVTRQQWHWVVYDYDGDTLRLYLDGVEVDAYTQVEGPLLPSQDELALGDGGVFSGVVDELRLSSTSRTPGWYAVQHAAMVGELFVLGDAEGC